jgi:hypothetical protein
MITTTLAMIGVFAVLGLAAALIAGGTCAALDMIFGDDDE